MRSSSPRSRRRPRLDDRKMFAIGVLAVAWVWAGVLLVLVGD